MTAILPVDTLTRLAAKVAAGLAARGETIAVCESSMGGLLSAALVAIPGASGYFLGSATIYTLASRKHLLGMDESQLTGVRPATEAYALLCARTIQKKLGSTWALAETGATGPDANPYMDPPGTAWIAITGPKETTLHIETGRHERENNMWRFAELALNGLYEIWQSEGKKP